jgi:bacteriocin-like protein
MRELDIHELNHVTGGVLLTNGKPATAANFAYLKQVTQTPVQHAPGFNPSIPGGGILESVPHF